VEIPIVFSGETPQSGEAVPFDPSQLEEHPLRDTVPTGKPTVRDTDVTGRPSVDIAGEARSPVLPRRKTLRIRPVTPDDTLADLSDDPDGGEPTQLMPARAPKAPRR
jgi:hypothetical protein